MNTYRHLKRSRGLRVEGGSILLLGGKKGFVLIAVLFLVSLITVLVVGSALLAGVERHATANDATTNLAQQNALLALNVALGQLQREAGPDQRVTARADILDTTTASTNIGNSTLNQPFWTGVWKTYNPSVSSQSLDVGSSPLRPWSTASTNVAWLVSGFIDGSTAITPSSFPASGVSSVTVATNAVLVSGSYTNMAVQVPLVPISLAAGNGQTKVMGHYGYWVSDEGIKAKVNMVDGSTTLNGETATTTNPNVSDLFRNQNHFRAPAANATYLGLPSTLNTDYRSNTNSWAVTSLASLQYVPSTAATFTPNQYTADYTTYSMGVLADAKNGGLKKDLTAALETESNFQALFPSSGQSNWQRVSGVNGTSASLDTGQVFCSDNASATTYTTAGGTTLWFDGIRWQSLYNYYNLYNKVMPYSLSGAAPANNTPYGIFSAAWSGSTPGAFNPAQLTVNSGPYGIEQRIAGIIEGSPTAYFAGDWITPVVLATKLSVVLGATQLTTGANAGKYQLEVRWYPEMVVWNPYNVILNGAYASAAIGFNGTISRTWNVLQFVSGKGITINNAGATPGVPGLSWNSNGSGLTNTDFSPQPQTGPYPTVTTAIPTTSLPSQTGAMYPGEVRMYTLSTPGSTNNYPAGGWLFSGTSGAYACTNAATFGGNQPGLSGNANYAGNNNSPANFNYVVCNNPAGTYYAATNLIYVTGPTAGGSAGNAEHTYITGIPTWPGGATTNNAAISDGGSPGRPSFTGPPNTSVLYQPGVQISSLASSPQLLVSYFQRAKGIQPTSNVNFYNYNSNVPVFLPNCPSFNPLDDSYSGANQELESASFSTFNANESYISAGYNNGTSPSTPSGFTDTTWGILAAGDTSTTTTPAVTTESQVVVREIPTQPLVSLGQFTQMPCTYYSSSTSNAHLPMGMMLVGGSTPNPGIPLNTTYAGATVGPGLTSNGMNDDSYMVNQGLFDGYYFSTVPTAANQYLTKQGSSLTPAGISPFNGFNQSYVNSGGPLPNGRMRYYSPSGGGNSVTGGSPAVLDLQDPRKAAANLLLDGAFNVNSTSVAAWTALLGSLSGNSLKIWNAYFKDNSTGFTGGPSTSYTSLNLQYSIPRFLTTTVVNTGAASATGATPGTGPWDGAHPYTLQQITELAQEIVRQVKFRGPFLSMADFLNRRLNSTTLTSITDSYQQAEGALQAAIDAQTGSTYATYGDGVNTTAISYGTTVSTAATLNSAGNGAGTCPVPVIQACLPKYTAIGTPAYLMQQDIIQAFAPVMTVRSDTFVVRCYGEADNPSTGAVQAQAWGEAVVQRVPDYVDQSDPALTTAQTGLVPPIASACGNATPPYSYNGTAVVDATNIKLGRRFKIVSFHWLNQNEL